jgi:glutamate-1-semialdehyde 2,1-aminomutase
LVETTCNADQILQHSREMFDRELGGFVPDRVFDAHFEIWDKSQQLDGAVGVQIPTRWEDVQPGCDVLHPGRQVRAAFIPFAYDATHVDRVNEWSSQQAARSGGSCCSYFFARPDDDPEWLREQVQRLGAVGLKSYHTYSATQPTWEADIPQYLPEPFVEVADQEGWVINMHLVKSRAVADPGNIHWIRHYCKKYPNIKLILSHSARGFQPEHNLEGLPQLADLENLYFDSSVNCEPTAHEAIIRYLGHDRLLYGSDYPCSHVLGRYIAIGDSFAVVDADNPVWQAKHTRIRPALVGLEHLRSLKWACWSQRLSDSQVEDIFYGNAERVFGPWMRFQP